MNEKYSPSETLSTLGQTQNESPGNITGKIITIDDVVTEPRETTIDDILILETARTAYSHLVHELGHYMVTKLVGKTPRGSPVSFIALDVETKKEPTINPEDGKTTWNIEVVVQKAHASLTLRKHDLEGKTGK